MKFLYIISLCSFLNISFTSCVSSTNQLNNNQVIISKEMPELRITVPRDWKLYSQAQHIKRVTKKVKPEFLRQHLTLAKMANLYISNKNQELLPEIIIIKTRIIKNLTEKAFVNFLVDTTLKQEKTTHKIGSIQIFPLQHHKELVVQELEYTQHLKSMDVQERSLIAAKYINGVNYLISASYKPDDIKNKERLIRALKSIEVQNHPIQNIQAQSQQSIPEFINPKTYLNRNIPLRISFPELMYLRTANSQSQKVGKVNRNLFSLFRYQIGSPVILNPQFDCYAYPESDLNKKNMSVTDFISFIDQSQFLMNKKKILYTPIKKFKSNYGIEFQARSTFVHFNNVKIKAKQYYAKINDHLIFCTTTQEKNSQEDSDFFDKILKSFSLDKD